MSNDNKPIQRLQWIDISKGCVILLVVALHIGLLFDTNEFLKGLVFHSWAMPFFYITSGLFISHGDDLHSFLLKKTNQLIVPLCFFVFTTNTIFWIAGDLLGGADSGWIQRKFQWVSTLQFCWYEGRNPDFRNLALWFLPALFNASVMYRFIVFATKDRWLMKLLWVSILTIGMLSLYQCSINLPLFIDVGVLALPYMLVGDFLKNRTNFISTYSSDNRELWLGICSFVVFLVCYIIQVKWQFFLVKDIMRYITATAGTLFVLWGAKRVHFSRFLSFCGRNSLVILGVHLPLTAFRPILMRFISNELALNWLLFLIVVSSACALSFLFDRYIPRFVGKKALLKS